MMHLCRIDLVLDGEHDSWSRYRLRLHRAARGKDDWSCIVGPLIADRALASPRIDAAIHAEDFCC